MKNYELKNKVLQNEQDIINHSEQLIDLASVGATHSHLNKSVLDLLSDVDGELYYNDNPIGSEETGTGDMLKSTYDADNDGVVDVAEVANSVAWTNVTDKPTLSTVATSGSYTDLTNKPTFSDTIVDESITIDKTNFLSHGKNYFNKDGELFGGYLNLTNGTVVTGASNYISGYLLIDPNIAYVKNVVGEVCFYDSNKTFISSISSTIAVANYSFTTPSNAKYMRVNMRTNATGLLTAQLEEGTTPTTYEAYNSYVIPTSHLYLNEIIDSATHDNYSIKRNVDNLTASSKMLISDYQLMSLGDFSLATSPTITRERNTSFDLFKRCWEVNLQFEATASNKGMKMTVNYSIGTNHAVGDYIQYAFLTNNISSAYKFWLTTTNVNVLPSLTQSIGNGWYFVSGEKQITQTDIDANINISEIALYSYSAMSYNLSVLCPLVIISKVKCNMSAYMNNLLLQLNSTDGKYEGMIWDSMGDSITANGGYQAYVKETFKIKTVNNLGIGGCTLADNGNPDQVPMVVRYQSQFNPSADIITIMGGTNDFGQNIALENESNKYDRTTFKGALREILEWLQLNYKNKTIACMTLVPNYYPARSPSYLNSNGQSIHEYSQAIRDVCREYSVPVIEITDNCYIGLNNVDLLLPDGIHPSSEGHKRIANIIASKLKSL